MTKRLLYFTALSLIIAFALRASPPIGAVVQSWSYDPKTNSVTLKIANTSHKDITAFNITHKETYADGRVEQGELLEELMGKIIIAKELQGNTSRGAENFRKMHGDGAFHPGEVRDEIIGAQPGFQKIEALVDVVTYADATAEATNNDGLRRIIDERQATVAAQKIITETIKTALADPNDTDPSATAAKKIQDRASVWKAQQHSKLDLDAGHLEALANQIKSVSSRGANSNDKRDALKQIVSKEEVRLSVLLPNAVLVKTGDPQ